MVPSSGLFVIKNSGNVPLILLPFNSTCSKVVSIDQSGNGPEISSLVEMNQAIVDRKETS